MRRPRTKTSCCCYVRAKKVSTNAGESSRPSDHNFKQVSLTCWHTTALMSMPTSNVSRTVSHCSLRVAPPRRPSRLLDSRRQVRGPHQRRCAQRSQHAPTRRHPSAPQHAGAPGCSQVTAVLCTGARGRDTSRLYAWGNALHGDFKGGSPGASHTPSLPPSRWPHAQRRYLGLHARY